MEIDMTAALATSFRLPFSSALVLTQDWGVQGGLKNLPLFVHLGEDYSGPVGTAIKATANGRVIATGTNDAFGKFVIVEHILPDLTHCYSLYAHLAAVTTRVGADLHMGDTLGSLGSTGAATGAHLHFEISFKNLFLNAGAYGRGYDSELEFATTSRYTLDPSKFIAAHAVSTTQVGSAASDSIWGLSTSETLKGNDGNDTIQGNSGSDKILGGNGSDYLYGGSGNDTLTGGAGTDVMSGGSGSDVFDFDKVSEMATAATTADVIVDFVRGQDKIDLSTIDAKPGTTTNDGFTFIYSALPFFMPGQVKFVGGALLGNTDWDTAPEFVIRVQGVTTLSASDLVL
jgi:serralysin